MTMFQILGAAAAIGTLAGPAVGQATYPQPSQQTYPPGSGYPNQNYGTNVIQQIIDQLLGNRYNVTDRTAVGRCASAALAKAQRQYPYGAYGRPYGYDQRYYPRVAMRVAAITEVRRRSNGLRVRGLIDSGAYGYSYQYPYQNPYGNQPYANPRYAQTGDLTFRCDVDYRGRTSNVRISRNTAYRR